MAKIRPFGDPQPPTKAPRVRPPAPPPTLFEQLVPCSWRDINFPISNIKVTIAHDLVEHKYWGVDGASVENTGRAPLQFEATIPFVNGIVPGKGETWSVLYPTTFEKFRTAFADGTSGVLIHPDLGGFLCKPASLDYEIDAQRRDGVFVSAKWVETLDEEHNEAVFEDSVFEAVDIAALDLDASKDDIVGLAPEAAFPEETFDSLVNKASGLVDSTVIATQLLVNKPAQLLNRVKTLQNSLERARSVLLWPAIDACERIKEQFQSRPLNVHGAAAQRPVARYTTSGRSTLATLAGSLPKPHSADDLIKLNPQLASKPEVPAGTVIRYYV